MATTNSPLVERVTHTRKARSEELWQQWYRALREKDSQVYYRSIRYAEAIAHNQGFNLRQAAEVERQIVMFACELLHISLPCTSPTDTLISQPSDTSKV